jgi:hypothetical protein
MSLACPFDTATRLFNFLVSSVFKYTVQAYSDPRCDRAKIFNCEGLAEINVVVAHLHDYIGASIFVNCSGIAQ